MKIHFFATAAIFGTLLLLIGPNVQAKPVKSKEVGAVSAGKNASTALLIVQGTIKSIAKTPRPETVTYKNSVTEIHLTNVKALRGKMPEASLLIYMQAMKAKKWTPAATYKTGQTVQLKLQEWEKVENTYGSMQRHALSIDEVGNLKEYWGEPSK